MEGALMTPQEFRDRVYDLVGDLNYHAKWHKSSKSQTGSYNWRDPKDPERVHSRLDQLMEEVLLELGYQEGIEMIRETTRWYA